jgi:peptidoglycan/LPS O-acetylase OafA/YrhL
MNAKRGYRADIDGLRGVAVLGVVLFHAFPFYGKGGFIGVDIFFVISGYLITRIVLDEIEQGIFSISGFYARRIRRIFPALLLVLLACLAGGTLVMLPSEYRQLARHVVAGVLFVPNLAFLEESGDYFGGTAEEKPLLHLWSLGIEEQFYLLWPVLVLVLTRLKWKLPACITGLALASFACNLFWSIELPSAAFFSPLGRFHELLLGALVASLPAPSSSSIRSTFSFVGAALILVGFLLINPKRMFPGGWVLLPVVGTAMLIAARSESKGVTRLLAFQPLVWVGLISYPLYLWHWPLLSFARLIDGGEPSRYVRTVCVVLSVGLAWLTYRYIETPIRRSRSGWQAAKVPALCVLAVSLGGAGFWVHQREGFPDRLPELKEFQKDGVSHGQASGGAPSSRCSGAPAYMACSGAQTGSEKILVIGDSHSQPIVTGLIKEIAAENQPVIVAFNSVTAGGCYPLRHVESYYVFGGSRGCQPQFDDIYTWAAQDPSVKVVVIVARWASRVGRATGFGRVEDGGSIARGAYVFTDGQLRMTDNDQIFTLGLQATLDVLERAGKKVVFLHQVPEFGFYPPFCGPRPVPITGWSGRGSCTLPQGLVNARQAAYRRLLEPIQAQHASLAVVDPLPLLCDGALCSMIGGGGQFLYRDDDHLNLEGGRLVARLMLSELRLQGTVR